MKTSWVKKLTTPLDELLEGVVFIIHNSYILALQGLCKPEKHPKK